MGRDSIICRIGRNNIADHHVAADRSIHHIGHMGHRTTPTYWGEDPSRVVIDEIVGVWIPLSLIIPFEEAGHKADSLWWAVIALVLFRFYDMVKPLGIKRLDRMRGAFYVMADDILGGVYAAITMVIIKIALAWVR